MLPVLYWNLALGMLNGEDTRVGPDGIGSRHVAHGVKGVGEGSLQAIMSWTMDVELGAVTLINCALRADLREMIILGGKQCTRAG